MAVSMSYPFLFLGAIILIVVSALLFFGMRFLLAQIRAGRKDWLKGGLFGSCFLIVLLIVTLAVYFLNSYPSDFLAPSVKNYVPGFKIVVPLSVFLAHVIASLVTGCTFFKTQTCGAIPLVAGYVIGGMVLQALYFFFGVAFMWAWQRIGPVRRLAGAAGGIYGFVKSPKRILKMYPFLTVALVLTLLYPLLFFMVPSIYGPSNLLLVTSPILPIPAIAFLVFSFFKDAYSLKIRVFQIFLLLINMLGIFFFVNVLSLLSSFD